MPKIKAKNNYTRAAVQPNSFNAEANTITVMASTGERGLRYDWDMGQYYEQLEVSETAVRLDRLNNGGQVLDSHSSRELKNVLGVVSRAWVESGQLMAEIKLSSRAEVAGIVKDIQDGIISNVSVGYKVHKFAREAKPENEEYYTYTAIDWEPTEISFVSVPFESGAGTRSENDFINLPDEGAIKTEMPKPNTELTPDEIRAQAVADERTRSVEIRQATVDAGLDAKFADEHITAGTAIDEFRALAIKEIARKQATPPAQPKVGGGDGLEQAVRAMEDAVLLRAGTKIENPHKDANLFRGMSIVRMAEEFVRIGGTSTSGMSTRDILQNAFGRGMHSTSDFPIILGNTVNRTLRAEYALQARTFEPWTTRTTHNDFRLHTKTQISGLVGELDLVSELGEYKAGTQTEAAETYGLKKYGKKIGFSWEMMINDDLGAFMRSTRALAQGAARKQSNIIYSLLTGAPVMSDSKTLFHADHGNLGSASDITATALGLAMKAMRNQKSVGGVDFINVTPRYLIVGPAKEQSALQLVASTYLPTSKGDAVLGWMKNLIVIVEPRIVDNAWFLSSDPNMVETIEYAFLTETGEFEIEQKEGFDVDGLELKIRMPFGAAPLDWRGLYKNPGA